MHFRKLIDAACLAAEDFVDAEFRPVERTLTIKAVTKSKPPAGGKEKACFHFQETEKTAFLANGEVKKIASMLRRGDTDQWIGASLVITSAAKKFAGKDTSGMVVVRATLPKLGASNVGA